MAAVVVLPFVADTSTLPRFSREASIPSASGSSASSSLPGALVAPPPRRRDRTPSARASTSLGASMFAISCA